MNAGNLIANNPQISNGTSYVNTTTIADLMPAGSGNSFSYDFVAGAFFAGAGKVSADPNAVVPVSTLTPAVTGNVTINGHTSYGDGLTPVTDTNGNALTIVIPTLVRTGTGSITITAAGNVAFLDPIAPGAVYTAGAATTTPADFTAPALPSAYASAPNGLVNTPTWATRGGPVTVTAGQSIIGIETTFDNSQGSQTGVAHGSTGQFWSDWYDHYGLSNGSATPFATTGPGALPSCQVVACQTAAWVNYATFFQGFGALAGGNVTLTAGRNITDVAASLPETVVVGGGTTASDPPHATYYGGGNLVVNAGGDLLSSDFLVGRGAGLIRVGGSAQADLANPITGLPTTGGLGAALPLLLAVQDGFISVAARGPVTLGNVFDPASLPLAGGLLTNYKTDLPGAQGSSSGTPWSNLFTTFGPESGVSLTSTNGDVTALTIQMADGHSNGLFLHNTQTGLVVVPLVSNTIGLMLPATLSLVSMSGNVDVNNSNTVDVGNANLVPYPTQAGNDTGTINIVAAGSINLGAGLAMPDLNTGLAQYIGARFQSAALDYTNYISPLGVPQPNLTQALHANDPAPVIIAAGQDIIAAGTIASGGFNTRLSLLKPAVIEAGHNIVGGDPNLVGGSGLNFVGENNNLGDITIIAAGNDLVGGSYVLYGPGTLVVQAGHDMGPFAASSSSTSGIATIGDGSAVGSTFATFGLPVRPYLPSGGAEIDVLFGVKSFGVAPSIDYAAAIAQFVNPANTGAGNINLLPSIATQVGELLDRYANAGKTDLQAVGQLQALLATLGLPPLVAMGQPTTAGTPALNQAGLIDNSFKPAFTVTPGQVWTSGQAQPFFQTLTQQQQNLMVNRAFLDFLTQVTKDDKDPTSPFFNQFGRAYQAIATLFPASLGYTNNASGAGGANGASVPVQTGNLNLAASVLETQKGGDINILGPGGSITVGHSTQDTLNPSQEGILTLAVGTIRAFTDTSIVLNQSRIMTLQGGNIDLFSANGDISAGSGPKTYLSDPPISDICDVNGFCSVNPQGLVTGAGIGALITLPGQVQSLSNVSLAAPHGTIDAGAAGLRGNDITVAALQVLNSFNIQATGTVTGLTFTPPPNVTGALTAQSTAGAVQSSVAAPTQQSGSGPASVIIVQVIGYGGGGEAESNDNDDQRRRQQQQ